MAQSKAKSPARTASTAARTATPSAARAGSANRSSGKAASRPPGKSSGKSAPRNARPSEADLEATAEHLERELALALLQDAVHSARRALDELQAETRNQPHERRQGLRLREKALRVENAFNRLRALRRGELLPPRYPEE